MSKSRIAALLQQSMEDARAAEAAADEAANTDQTNTDQAAGQTDGGDADAAAADAAPIVADPDTLEADLVDVNAAEGDVQENTDAVAELSDVQEGLEAIALSLEAACENGGLTAQSAQFLQIAVESYNARLGEETAIPSLESFGGQTSRASATQLSLEGVRETLQRVWEAIKAVVLKVRDAIVALWRQLISGAERLRVRAEKLKGVASKLSGTAKQGEIELGGLAAKIAVGTKVEVNSAAITHIAEIAASAFEFDEAAGKHLAADYTALEQAVNSGERVQSAGELAPPKAFSESVTGGVSTKVLPGNVSFQILVNTGIAASGDSKAAGVANKAISGSGINKLLAGGWSVTRKAEDVKVDNGTKIKTLDFATIGHIAEECVKIGELVQNGEKQMAQNAKQISAGLKKLRVGKEVAEDKVAGVKADLKAFQRRLTAQDQAASKVAAYAVNTARAFLAVAEKSAAQYGNQTAVAKTDDAKAAA